MEPNDRTLATDLPSELLLESLPPLNESLLCGHGFFLRGLPLRFGAENKWRTDEIRFHLRGFPYEKPRILTPVAPSNCSEKHTHVW